MKAKRVFALLAAFGLTAAACGSSTDEASETSTDVTEAATEGTDSTDGETEPVTPGEPAAEIATDFGVTDDTIKIGINADLSGPFASLVSEIVEGQKAYWEIYNAGGGLNGRSIETVILDSGYDTDTGIQNYKELAQESDAGVLMISENTGSPITAALAEDAIDDNMLLIPLSWASLWPDPVVGEAVLEKQTTYCIESMNGVSWLKTKVESDGKEAKLAIIGRPGEYGEDGSVGAQLAADELGIEVVYDGTGAVAGDDRTAIVSELVSSGATMVWITLTPGETLDIFGQAVTQGFDAIWSGNQPSFNYLVHLGSDFAAEFDQFYYQSGYQVPWTTEGNAALDELKATMAEALPDANISEGYLIGFLEGIMVQTLLEQAAANGDMTRAGMMQASKEISVDFKGLSPNQTWSGDYDTDVVRESYIYDVDATAFNIITMAEDAETGAGSTGYTIEEGPYVSDLVAGYTFDEPCI